jgi:hypothetical protein
MIPEDLDLAELARDLQRALGHRGAEGYLRGKSLMRDLLVEEHRFSQLEAEELVDTLELRGFLHFLGDPSRRSVVDAGWDIDPDPDR